jgi:hypothetical protein
VVDVEHDRGQVVIVPARVGDQAVELAQQVAPVGDPGEGILEEQRLEPPLWSTSVSCRSRVRPTARTRALTSAGT